MKKLLIISPYFPPSNAADMQRIRMSLPYFKDFGWQAEVVTVDEKYSEIVKDGLLLQSIPKDIVIHGVKAFSKKWTSKFGLGSLALRSIYFYRQKVNRLLREKHFDLIYFSTTQFPVCVLGAYWKKKFGVPYVIDMQDPWHSDYYRDKPKIEKPKKYWFSYRLNKYLEPLAMKHVDGLISVSETYIQTLKERYPTISQVPAAVITFGAFEKDFEIAAQNSSALKTGFKKTDGLAHLVYLGRGGHDMTQAVQILFQAFQMGLHQQNEWFKKLRFHFIGTSYAPSGTGKNTISPIADDMNISAFVQEQTNRLPFYQSIQTLLQADLLFIPGSNDPAYTASKIYPYILAQKPILAIFSSNSSAYTILKNCQAANLINLNSEKAVDEVYLFLFRFLQNKLPPDKTNWNEFEKFSASTLTRLQCELFDCTCKLC